MLKPKLPVIFSVLVLFSCSKVTRMDKLSREEISFVNFPDTVREVYWEICGPKTFKNWEGKSIKGYKQIDTLICIEIENCNCNFHKILFGTFIRKFKFQINCKEFEMPFNYNTINPPYIVYKRNFYFLSTMDIMEKADLLSARFGKFDLSDVW